MKKISMIRGLKLMMSLGVAYCLLKIVLLIVSVVSVLNNTEFWEGQVAQMPPELQENSESMITYMKIGAAGLLGVSCLFSLAFMGFYIWGGKRLAKCLN